MLYISQKMFLYYEIITFKVHIFNINTLNCKKNDFTILCFFDK